MQTGYRARVRVELPRARLEPRVRAVISAHFIEPCGPGRGRPVAAVEHAGSPVLAAGETGPRWSARLAEALRSLHPGLEADIEVSRVPVALPVDRGPVPVRCDGP